MPVGPPGFVALGVYCRFGVHGQGPPNEEEADGLVVVHHFLIESCDFVNTSIWSDAGSGATHNLTLGQLPHMALWPSHTDDPEAGILPAKYTLKSEYIHT